MKWKSEDAKLMENLYSAIICTTVPFSHLFSFLLALSTSPSTTALPVSFLFFLLVSSEGREQKV